MTLTVEATKSEHDVLIIHTAAREGSSAGAASPLRRPKKKAAIFFCCRPSSGATLQRHGLYLLRGWHRVVRITNE